MNHYRDRRAVSPDNAAREQQVCARVLWGMTNPGIALDLAVQLSTVKTLRRRALARLGISSLGELLLRGLWPDASSP